jgi:hypothetical protein
MFILDEFRKVVLYPGGKIARIDNTLSMISSRYIHGVPHRIKMECLFFL